MQGKPTRAAAPPPPAAELEALARRVATLLPCWRDPSRFFEERSELSAELRRLARRLAGAAPSAGASRWQNR
jgi:hypothetical protein